MPTCTLAPLRRQPPLILRASHQAPCADGPQPVPPQVFLHHWLALGWPTTALVEELEVGFNQAAPVLCWMLQHRPSLLAQISLGPHLLLRAIAHVAPPRPTPKPLPAAAQQVVAALSEQWTPRLALLTGRRS